MTRIASPTKETIQRAAELLRQGDVVAMPTETVYGLAADATNDKAIARVFALKNRPEFNPLIIHGAGAEVLRQHVVFDDRAEQLVSVFWPGPLTLVLPRREDSPVSQLAGAGLPTLAVRAPAHPAAQELLKVFGGVVAAPSANKSGTLSPTAPVHVADGFGDEIPLILSGGKCRVGLESTVLDLTGPAPVILRYGAVLPEDLEPLVGPVQVSTGQESDRPKSPGQLLRHYAPRTTLRLNAVDLAPGEALLAFGSTRFMGIRGGGAVRGLGEDALQNLSESGDLTEAAANLFSMLHRLDAGGHEGIAVMPVPETGLGIAINDRLRRAAQGRQQG